MKGFHKLLLLLIIITQGCGGGSNPSCNDCDNPTPTPEEPKYSIKGRVIDGPLSNATVFIDLNDNDRQDDNEPSTTTDEAGFFDISSSSTEGTIVSRGGTDTETNVELPNLILKTPIPSDNTKPITVSPLTTLLFQVSEQEQQSISNGLGFEGDPETLSTQDHWALAKEGDKGAIAIQRVNQQIGLLMQTSDSLSINSNSDSTNTSNAVIQAIAEVAKKADPIDLTAAATIYDVLQKTSAAVNSSTPMDEAQLDAMVAPIVDFNIVIADPDSNPTSEVAAQITKISQQDLQTNIIKLRAGDISTEEFSQVTDMNDLLSNIELPEDAVDTDNDGMPDMIDSDNDGDGDLDNDDLAPINNKPSIKVTTNKDNNRDMVTIKWEANDPEDNAKIKLYVDTDNNNYDGQLISQDEFSRCKLNIIITHRWVK